VICAWGAGLDIPQHFPHAELHEYVVTPNHIHGIVELTEPVVADECWGEKFFAKKNECGKNMRAKNFSPLRGDIPNNRFNYSWIQNRRRKTNGWFYLAAQLLRTHY
jgi:REP element-mobilizing transposase RayT